MATLGDLGLSEYEARVYRGLLRTGPATAKQLSGASDVPMGRIYDVLNSLETSGVVRSQDTSRPKKYAAVDPETAFDRLLEEKREQLKAELEQYEAVVEELSEELEASGAGGEQFWTVAVGVEDTVDLLLERLGTASDEIIMVSAEPVAGFDLGSVGERFAQQIESVLERGVEVSVLASPALVDALPEEVIQRYDRSVGDHEGYEVRISDEITGTFNLIDRTEVCIEVRNPLCSDEAFALIDVTDPAFASNAYEEFRPRWEDAKPIER